jgi:O-methyltransferase involved in polyketide biosynthesis
VLDKAWMDTVGTHTGQHFFFVAEAIFPYLTEAQVKDVFLTLAERFPGSEITFDRIPSSLARLGGRWHPTLRTTRAQVRWGLTHSKALEAWSEDLRLIDEYRYLDGSKLFTGWSSVLRLLPSYWNGFKIVHYRLGVREREVLPVSQSKGMKV